MEKGLEGGHRAKKNDRAWGGTLCIVFRQVSTKVLVIPKDQAKGGRKKELNLGKAREATWNVLAKKKAERGWDPIRAYRREKKYLGGGSVGERLTS